METEYIKIKWPKPPGWALVTQQYLNENPGKYERFEEPAAVNPTVEAFRTGPWEIVPEPVQESPLVVEISGLIRNHREAKCKEPVRRGRKPKAK